MTIPELGSGLLLQISTDYDAAAEGVLYAADLQSRPSFAAGGLSVRRPQVGRTPFKHVTWIAWYADRELTSTTLRTTIGVIGLAQPTPAGSIPLSGTASFLGTHMGYMGGNAGDQLVGTAAIQLDRGTARIDGSLMVTLQCMMGCSYPEVEYRLRNASYSAGGQTFSAELTTTGTAEIGRLTATFAGPDGKELLIKYELPFFDPNYQIWTKAGGVVLARTD